MGMCRKFTIVYWARVNSNM